MTHHAAPARRRRGREDQKREPDLDHQRRRCQGGEYALRQLRRIPGEWRGQRLRPEMVVECGQATPRRVARHELGHARHEQVAEHEPAIQPDDNARPAAQKDREKSGFEQQSIPLERHELLPGMREGQIEDEQADERRSHDDTQHDDERQRHACPRAGDECGVARVQPEQHRRDEVGAASEIAMERVEVGLEREHARAADESQNLNGERDERGEVDKAEAAQEDPAHQVVTSGFERRTPQQPGRPIQQTAPEREELVRPFGDGCETGDVSVQPPPHAAPRRKPQHLKRCRGSRIHRAVGRNELDRALERFDWNRRIVGGRVLVGAIVDLPAG